MTEARFLLWVGLVAWLLVVGNFAIALVARRSTIRAMFLCMSFGCSLALARELRILPLRWAVALHMCLVVFGVFAAGWLVLRFVHNPRSVL